MSILIISCSLNPESKSRLLAEFAFNALQDLSVETQFINLQNYDLPICDGADAYNHPALTELSEAIAAADGIILATPIYNYNVAAATKNLLELTNDAWNHRSLGFSVPREVTTHTWRSCLLPIPSCSIFAALSCLILSMPTQLTLMSKINLTQTFALAYTN